MEEAMETGAHNTAQHTRLPVSYRFLEGARRALRRGGETERGTNCWDVPPSAERPVPIVLLHGTAGSAVTNWATLGPVLVNEGFSVFDLTYGVFSQAKWPWSQLGGLRPIATHSLPEVTAFVESVLEATGAEKVDLIGHSQGCLLAGAVAKHTLPGRVRKVITLAAPWSGVGGGRIKRMLTVAGLQSRLENLPTSLDDMVDGSHFVRWLHEPDGTPYAKDVEYVNIASRFDPIVTPHTISLPWPPAHAGYTVTNIVLQDGCMLDFVDHAALPSDPRAVDYVLQALDPTLVSKIRCQPTVPVYGGLLPSEDDKIARRIAREAARERAALMARARRVAKVRKLGRKVDDAASEDAKGSGDDGTAAQG